MGDFIIKQINKGYAKYLVFGTSVDSPLFQLIEIKNTIEVIDGDKIIFDQLLQTGNADNRFLVMTFINRNFDYSSAKNINYNIIDEEVKAFACDYLRKNVMTLKYSVLLSEQKEIILNGGII